MPELPARVERIVLIGLMGAGKTTVGHLLARELRWTFVDLDTAIEAQAQKSVARIFAEDGEPEFRRLERELTARLASSDRTVFTPGGGWVMQAQAVAQLPEHTAVFWLQVSPEAAVQRLQQDATVRPLLQRPDPLAVARRLASERNKEYERLGVPIDTLNRSPHEIVMDIMHNLGSRIDSARTTEPNG